MSFGHHCHQIIPVYVVLREFRKVVFPTLSSLFFLILEKKKIHFIQIANFLEIVNLGRKLALRK